MRGSPLRQLRSTPGLVALYLPWLQIAQGLTGQSLIDYSGKGNHAQLGSTAGEDTNDPTWGTNALTFDGTDDYVNIPNWGNGDLTVYTVFNRDELQLDSAPGLWSRNNIMCYGQTSLRLLYTDTTLTSRTSSSIGIPHSTWLLGTARLSASGYWSWSINNVGTLSFSGYTPHPTYTGWGHTLGSYQDRYLACGVACHIMFNRVLSDEEASRVRANIVTLMNGQGVTVA